MRRQDRPNAARDKAKPRQAFRLGKAKAKQYNTENVEIEIMIFM